MSIGTPDMQPRTILIVDDDPTLRSMLSKLLSRADYRVLQAKDGQEGLAAYEEQLPEMVITDINMPNMNGYELCAAVRKARHGQYVPILIMTGSEGFESVDAAYNAGATDFVSKPLNFALLVHRIRYILRSRDTFVAWQETQEQRSKLGWVLNNSSNEIVFLDSAGQVTDANDSALRNAGFTRNAIIGKPMREIISPAKDRKPMGELIARFASGQSHETHFAGQVKRSNGTFYPIDGHIYSVASELTGEREMILMFEDVTQRKLTDRRMHKLAYYDALTNLPNRTLFVNNFKRHLELARRQKYNMALLFVDLDNFKDVNDTLGHNAGDELLRRLSQVILASIRAGDLMGMLDDESLSRFGGDEFAILLNHISRPADAIEISQRIINATKTPIKINGRELVVTPSIGIVLFPDHGGDVDTLLRKADIAMYEAKKRGRSSYHIYSDTIFNHGLDKQDMLRNLEMAVERKELVLYYQPKFFTESGAMSGFEALLRWNRGDSGLAPPDTFIPLAEESGLIRPMGAWVIWQACRQIHEWQQQGVSFPTEIAVNLSAMQLHDNEVVTTVEQALKYFQVDPANLKFEITETAIMENMSSCLDVLIELKTLGCRLSMDDFGTGYSSLSYLSQFPLDELKVDRSFISRISEDEGNNGIVRAIVAMSKSLGLQVVAEGIETPEQLDFVTQIGVEQFQGYLRARPMTKEDIETTYSSSPAIATTADVAVNSGANR
jgi:diguanylate cyclase (GGDEF)-like protein/PAS domain S-box-containing protein